MLAAYVKFTFTLVAHERGRGFGKTGKNKSKIKIVCAKIEAVEEAKKTRVCIYSRGHLDRGEITNTMHIVTF